MDTRITAFAFCLLSAGPQAFASAPQLVITVHNPARAYHAIRQAAEQVCTTAKRHDLFDDYGSLDDCVAATVATVEIRDVSPTRLTLAAPPAR